MERKSAKQVTLEKALSLFTVYGYEEAKDAQTEQESGFASPSYYKHYKKRPGILDAYLIKPGTKQIILEKSLNLFAAQGYDGVSMTSIAKAVGIKAPSIYKHYKNKQDIFDTILHEVAKRMQDARGRLIVPLQAEMTGASPEMLFAKLKAMYENLLSFYYEDVFVCSFRRMLSMERYHNADAEQLFQKIFFDDVLQMITNLFAQMITNLFAQMVQEGILTQEEPDTLAIAFYSPLFLLICKADNSGPTDDVPRIPDSLVQSFVSCYAKR